MLTIGCFAACRLPSFLPAKVHNRIIVHTEVSIKNHKIGNKSTHSLRKNIIFNVNFVNTGITEDTRIYSSSLMKVAKIGVYPPNRTISLI